jgi:protein-L-isoaspartate O-methyltransferase
MTGYRPPRKVHHVLTMPSVDIGEEHPFGREVAQEVDCLIDLMDLKQDEAILDVASGAGRHALELARREFRHVTAMDLSDQLLDIGRRAAAERGLEVAFVKGDARKPLAREEFDAALILGGGAFGTRPSSTPPSPRSNREGGSP